MEIAQIKVDPEFQQLIPPLSADERDLLEKNIIQDGCRDPLVVWDGILLDGHNRLEICKAHDIPFETVDASPKEPPCHTQNQAIISKTELECKDNLIFCS